MSDLHTQDAGNQKTEEYGLSDDAIDDILDALHHRYDEALVEHIASLSAADAADLLSKITEDDRDALLENHSEAFKPETYTELSDDLCRSVFQKLSAYRIASILQSVDSDEALNLVLHMEEEDQKNIMRSLSARLRLVIEEGLTYEDDTAGRLMEREFVAVPQLWTAGKTIDYIRAASDALPEDFFDVFIISPSHHVVGIIPLNKLLRADRSAKIGNLTLGETYPIPATMDQEEVAQIFRRENLTSAPVVDDDDRLIGVITIDDIVDVIDEEAAEDIYKLAGVDGDELTSAVFKTTKSRFRWLFLNLFTAIAASLVISLFEATLEQIVAVAILMPIVASMGGNAGTQTLTIAVRALSMKKLSRSNALRLIWKETLVGVINGALFAILIGIIAGLWFSNNLLGLVIGTAMIINLVIAGIFGAAIPIALHRAGSDPAVSSTVILTTVTDVIGFFVFLGLAGLFLL